MGYSTTGSIFIPPPRGSIRYENRIGTISENGITEISERKMCSQQTGFDNFTKERKKKQLLQKKR